MRAVAEAREGSRRTGRSASATEFVVRREPSAGYCPTTRSHAASSPMDSRKVFGTVLQYMEDSDGVVYCDR